MNLLAIETATENCSVALCQGLNTVEIAEVIPNKHSAKLHHMIQDLLASKGMELKELDAIAVDIGPGSFTGVRIGIGVAQGLAFASSLPAIGISSLAALAEPHRNSLVLSAIDARMGQVYWCLFDTRDGVAPLSDPMVSYPEQVGELISDNLNDTIDSEISLLGVGSGWGAYESLMTGVFQSEGLVVKEQHYPSAVSVAKLSAQQQTIPPAVLSAAYVRNDVAKKAVALK